MIDLSAATNPDGVPVIPTAEAIQHLQQRRADMAVTWTAAFDEGRRNNRPPKYEMNSSFLEYYTTAILLMYSVFDPSNEHPDYDVMQKFMDDMQVGGYRVGRSRYGQPWASIFVRNVQYCAVKFVPREMRHPDLVLFSLIGRASMQRMSEWLAETFSKPIDLRTLNRHGVYCHISNSSTGWRIHVQFMTFDHTFHLSEFLQFFVRTFDREYQEASQYHPSNPRTLVTDYDGDNFRDVIQLRQPAPWV